MSQSAPSRTSQQERSLADLLFQHPGEGDLAIVSWNGSSMTLDALRDAVEDLAAVLDEAGVRRGQVVAALVASGPTAIVAMFAIWLRQAVYMPLNARLTDSEIDDMLQETPASLVIGGTHRRGDAGFVVPADDGWRIEAPARADAPGFDADTALVMRTSGTTGRAKPVLLRHSGTLDGLDVVIARLRTNARPQTNGAERPSTPNLIPVSLAMWAGIYNTLFAFRVGSTVVLLDKVSAPDLAATIKRFAIRSTVLPPAMLTMLSDDPDVTDLSPLRFVRSITAPLRKDEAERFFEKFEVQVLNSYGQTELGGEVVGWNAADVRTHGSTKLGSVGRPHPGIVVEIRGADGDVLEAGNVGEIWVRSPFLMSGYADRGSSMNERLRDGFLQTGDVGWLDEDSFLWIEGRLSDMINRGGLKISPGEVEDVLREHPAVRDACVAAVPDNRLGEVPHAWIVPVDRRDVEAAELDRWCRTKLAPYKVPVGFDVVDELPRSEAGKVLRRALVDQLSR